jgi:hypothetical protein
MDWDKMKDSDILHRIITDFEAARMSRIPHEERWLRWYKLYRSYTEKKDTGANLFIPYTFSIVETVMPRLITTIFASRPYIGVLPVNQASVETAKMHELLLDYQLTQRINTIEVASLWIKEALMYGTSFLKTMWRYESRWMKHNTSKMDLFGVSVGNKVEEIETVLYDDPDVVHVDLWDIFVDPEATTIDDAEYVIHRVYRTKEYLKKQAAAGLYSNLEGIESSYTSSESELSADDRLDAVGLSRTKKQDDRIELLEYWTDDRVIVVANRSQIIRNEENPYWHCKKPFIRIVDHPVPHELYGIGEIEPIEYLQYELNDTRNQRMDNVNLIINRMWKVLSSSELNPEHLISRPGGVIQVNEMNEIEPLPVEDVTASAYAEETEIKRDIDRTMGVYSYARGETTDRRETATTASILSNAANERFKMKVQLMEDMGLRRLGLMLIQLNQQYMDHERVIRIVGDDGVHFQKLSPEDIAGEFDVMPIGSTVEPIVNKDTRLSQLLNLYSNIKDNPYIDHAAFLKRILEVADIKDTERIIIQQQQQAPIQQPIPGIDLQAVEGVGNLGR